jgi:hypothetical protein
VRAIADALGVRPRLVAVPPALFRAAGHLGDVLAHVIPWPFTSPTVARLLDSLAVDTRALNAAIGPLPHRTSDGLRETAAWFRERNRDE